MNYTTTLNAIREYSPCRAGWVKLLAHLGKTQADDEPIQLAVILESNGLYDALWCLRAVPEADKDIRKFALMCAKQVQHLMQGARSLKALGMCEAYLAGAATLEELRRARTDASYAAYAAADAAASYAADAADAAYAAAADSAYAAAAAADAAASYAAYAAASYAAYAKIRNKQKAMFIEMFCTE